MTTHACCYEAIPSRDAAAAHIGGNPNRTWTTEHAVAFETGGLVSQVLEQPVIPISCYADATLGGIWIPAMHVFGFVGTDTPGVVAVETHRLSNGAQAYWAIDGAAVDNGVPTIQPLDPITFGRNAPPPSLRFAADVLGTDVVGVTAEVTVHWQEQLYDGHYRFMEFEETPQSNALVSTRAQELLKTIAQGKETRYLLGVTSSGVSRYAEGCSFAGLGPDATVWLAQGDIGNQNEQIPQSVGDNTASHFRFHPSCFFRRGPYYRALARRTYDGTDISAEQQNSQPFRIRVATSAPTRSTWLLSIDGAPQIVTLFHGTLDLRRPVDIWNALLLPLIRGSQTIAGGSLIGGLSQQSATENYFQARMGYVEFARFLSHNGDTTDDPQDDTINPG